MEKQLVANNFLISYSEFGQGENVLLFLPGWRSSKEVWKAAIERLKDSKIENFLIYAVDLPGFGGSQIPSKPLAVGDYAQVVAEFIKKLELKNVIIVGHSFGGRVGIKLAAKYPAVISQLVLVDSAGFAMNPSRKKLFAVMAKIVKPFFTPQFMQSLRRKIYKKIGAEDYLATPQLQKTFVNITSEDLAADMKKIICPTLIIYGENDKDTPVEFGKRMQPLILNSKFLILKNAGHFSFSDQPEEFVGLLTRFIE